MMTQGERTKVTKFGGTSLADAAQVAIVKSILESDATRRIAIVSAPGKRSADDQKLTDLLYQWCNHVRDTNSNEDGQVLAKIKQRFLDIARFFFSDSEYTAYESNLTSEFKRYEHVIQAAPAEDYIVSRGEYLMAQLVAKILQWEFIDATELIRFKSDGSCDWEASYTLIGERLYSSGRFVIPGFYGIDGSGQYVKTFSRGGSDVSAAIIAAGIQAELYENWTDTDGLMSAHPEYVPKAECVPSLYFGEALNAACLGMNALHPDALYPLMQRNIPVVVKNTNNPTHPGTRIASDVQDRPIRPVTMLAGRTDFVLLQVNKSPMHEVERVETARTITDTLQQSGVANEYAPVWTDATSVVIDMKGTSQTAMESCRATIEANCEGSSVTLEAIALISVVGAGMQSQIGVVGIVSSAISSAGVNIRIMHQGPSETGMLYGVSADDLAKALQAVHSVCIV